MPLFRLLFCLALLSTPLQARDFLEARMQIRQDPEQAQRHLDAMPPSIKVSVDHLLQQAYVHFYQDEVARLEALLSDLERRSLTPYQEGFLRFIQGRHQAWEHGNYDAAVSYLQRGHQVLATEQDPLSKALRLEVMISNGSLLNYRRQLEEGQAILSQAVELAKSLGDDAHRAEAHFHLGKNFRYREQAEPASHHYQQALALADAVAEPTFPGRMLMELARLYRDLGGLDQALEYAHQAVQTLEPLGSKGLTSNALTDLGNIYRDAGDITQALHHYYLARDLLVADNAPFGVARTQHDIGTTLLEAGQPEQGLPMLEEAQQMFEQRQHQRFLLANGLSLARTLAALERWPEVQARLEPLLEMGPEPAQRKAILMTLATSLQAQGQLEAAWPVLEEAARLEGRSTQEDRQLKAAHQFALEQMRREVKELEQQRGHLEAESERHQRHELILLILLGLLLLVSLWQWGRIRTHGRNLDKARKDSLTQGDSGVPNRDALYQALATNPTSHLVLLRLGTLPGIELQVGRYQFARLRTAAQAALSSLDWIETLYEPSPGTFALLLVPGQEVQPRLHALYQHLRRQTELTPSLNAPVAAGVLPLPFQSGSLLRPDPARTLELVQLALWSASELADRLGQDSHVMLRPVAFSAPQLLPEQLYQSALRGIELGSIKALSSAPDAYLHWPVAPPGAPASTEISGSSPQNSVREAEELAPEEQTNNM